MWCNFRPPPGFIVKLQRTLLAFALMSALAGLPRWSAATVVYTALSTPLTTAPNPGGGNSDGTGVWFNPLTGYAESRGYVFPNPLYQDGMFFLLLDTASYLTPEAEIYTQGYFSRGNGVVYASAQNLNPIWLGAGATIGAATGFQSPGAGFPDIGPNYGNGMPGHGFLALTLRNPVGATSNDIFYGFADVTLNADYSLTLNGFAYENVAGASITTFSAPVPEPATAWAFGLGLLGIAAAQGRQRRRAR
jgi:hypothetical protein